jgi:hypothetical protein
VLKEAIIMIVFIVTAVLVALVIVAIALRESLRSLAFCPKRETIVDIVGGRCALRGGDVCANAPLGCENECIMVSDLATRAS